MRCTTAPECEEDKERAEFLAMSRNRDNDLADSSEYCLQKFSNVTQKPKVMFHVCQHLKIQTEYSINHTIATNSYLLARKKEKI